MADEIAWHIDFYHDARGGSPVVEFIRRLPPAEQAIVIRVLDLLQEFDVRLRLPHARPIAGFWELRAGPIRLLYAVHTGRRFIILHGYRKQTQHAPRQEIETARRRWAEFLER